MSEVLSFLVIGAIVIAPFAAGAVLCVHAFRVCSREGVWK